MAEDKVVQITMSSTNDDWKDLLDILDRVVANNDREAKILTEFRKHVRSNLIYR